MIPILVKPELDPAVPVVGQQAAGVQERQVTQAARSHGNVHVECSRPLQRRFKRESLQNGDTTAGGNLVRSQRCCKIDELEQLVGFERFSAFCGLGRPAEPITTLRRPLLGRGIRKPTEHIRHTTFGLETEGVTGR